MSIDKKLGALKTKIRHVQIEKQIDLNAELFFRYHVNATNNSISKKHTVSNENMDKSTLNLLIKMVVILAHKASENNLSANNTQMNYSDISGIIELSIAEKFIRYISERFFDRATYEG